MMYNWAKPDAEYSARGVTDSNMTFENGDVRWKTLNRCNYGKKRTMQLSQWQRFDKIKPLPINIKRNRKKMRSMICEMQILPEALAGAGVLGTAYLGSKFLNIVDKVDDSLEEARSWVSSIQSIIMSSLKNFSIKVYQSQKYAILMFDVLMSFVNVCMCKDGDKLMSLAVNISAAFFRFGAYSLAEVLGKFIKSRLFKYEMQISSECSYVGVFAAILLGLFGAATNKDISLPHFSELMKYMNTINLTIKNMKDFRANFPNVINSVLQYFGTNFFGYYDPEELSRYLSGYDLWSHKVLRLLDRDHFTEEGTSDKLAYDKATVYAVESLYRTGLDYSRDISDKKLPRELALYHQGLMKLITDKYRQTDITGAFGDKPRTPPLVIWLYGESGVGKSGMSWPLAIDMNNRFVTTSAEASSFSENIYQRNVEQEFWDNYHGQNIVMYDDFGQMKDTLNKPNLEFLEIIRSANIAAYPLHMAYLEDKRKTRFTSKVLILSSNVIEQNINSLSYPAAFRRRIDICAKVLLKKDYQKIVTNSKGEKMIRLDTDKTKIGQIDVDAYDIQVVDPETLKELERLDYNGFSAYCRNKLELNIAKGRSIVDNLSKYAEERFEMQIHNLTHFNIQPEKIEFDEHECGPGGANTADHFDIERKDFHDNLARVLADKQLLKDYVSSARYQFAHTTVSPMCKDIPTLFDTVDASIPETLKFDLPRVESILQPMTCSRVIAWVRNLFSGKKNFPIFSEGRLVQRSEVISFLHDCKMDLAKFGERLLQCEYYADPIVSRASSIIVSIKTICKKILNDSVKVIYDWPISRLVKFLLPVLGVLVAYGAFNFFFPKGLILVKEACSDFVDLSRTSFANVYRFFLGGCMKDGIKVAGVCLLPAHYFTYKKVLTNCVNDNVKVHLKKKILEVNQSGDQLTLAKARKILEIAQSGDQLTNNAKKQVIEIAQSGDNLTKTFKKVMESVKVVDITSPEELPVGGDLEMQAWKDTTAQLLITNRILSNQYRISKIVDKGLQPLMNGLFVRGNHMLLAGHITDFLKPTDVIEIRNISNNVYRIPYQDIVVSRIKDRQGSDKEAVVFTFPRTVGMHADLVKHFADSEVLSATTRSDVCLPLLRNISGDQLHFMLLGNTRAESMDEPVILETGEGNYTLRKGYSYYLNTIRGDCGSPLIVNETKVLRKIVGIHVAGSKSGEALAESVTRADLERLFNSMERSKNVIFDPDQVEHYKPKEVQLQFSSEISGQEMIERLGLPGGNFNMIGEISKSVFIPGKTSLRKSAIYGQVSEPITKPAHLKNVGGVDIHKKNMEKFSMGTPYIEGKMLDLCVEDVTNILISNKRPELARILTIEEAVAGCGDSEYMGPITRSTSPGYPWVFDKKSGKAGKRTWLGEEEYEIDDQLRQSVFRRIENARRGVRTPTVWTDTLKDERRPIAKVDAYKTRIFAHGPMDYTLAFRMYFLGFIAHIMENRITNEQSLGTNVYSQDWKRTVKKLSLKGDHVIAGDFQCFDGTLNSGIMCRFVDAANRFYDDDEDSQLIRIVLFYEVFNSMHLLHDLLFLMNHSQPSGNPSTTPLNSFYNSCSMRLVYLLCAIWAAQRRNIADFTRDCSMVSYGDDNVVNISHSIISWFNQKTITRAFAEFGMTYTDELKVGNEVPNSRTITDVTYLKRKFVKRGQMWIAPLDLSTCLEMCNWRRDSVDHIAGTQINCETAIRELALHERDLFDKFYDKIKKSFNRATNKTLMATSYDEINEELLENYYN